MKVRPLFFFYLIIILLCAFDYAMWLRHHQVSVLASKIENRDAHLEGFYKADTLSPLALQVRIQANAAHEKIKHLSKPWPIHNYYWNQFVLRAVFWFILPILMLWLLWLHFRQKRSE